MRTIAIGQARVNGHWNWDTAVVQRGKKHVKVNWVGADDALNKG